MIALVYPTVSLEGGVEVSTRIFQHMQQIPVFPQDLEHPGSQTILHQDIEEPVPFQGVIRILDIQEYGL